MGRNRSGLRTRDRQGRRGGRCIAPRPSRLPLVQSSTPFQKEMAVMILTALSAQSPSRMADRVSCTEAPAIVLSFDVEEHHRIEAAADLRIDPSLVSAYSARLGPSTRFLLERLDAHAIKATFFVVGEIARSHPDLIRDIHRAG